MNTLQADFEEQFQQLKQNFPNEYEAAVNQLIEQKLKDSQEDILNVIYPALGKMIKKYVTLQIKTFKDAVDERVKNTFTVKTFMQKMKASIFGVDESDMIFSDLVNYQVDAAYIIEKHSGLLVGHASRETIIDEEVLGGMLTAIKGFVEDAFKKERQNLSGITYDSFQIFMQSAPSYYLALAISGPLSSAEESKLGDKFLDFADEHLKNINSQNRDEQVEQISEQLRRIFIEN